MRESCMGHRVRYSKPSPKRATPCEVVSYELSLRLTTCEVRWQGREVSLDCSGECSRLEWRGQLVREVSSEQQVS